MTVEEREGASSGVGPWPGGGGEGGLKARKKDEGYLVEENTNIF